MRPFQFLIRSSLLLRPSKYSLHRGKEDRAHEILHRGCSRNFVVLTSRDIFHGKPPFFLQPSPLQRDRLRSMICKFTNKRNSCKFPYLSQFQFFKEYFFMNYRKNAILFLYVTVHEKAKIKNCFFSVSKA